MRNLAVAIQGNTAFSTSNDYLLRRMVVPNTLLNQNLIEYSFLVSF